MGLDAEARVIRWKLHLAASPDTVFRALDTAEGRARFWALSALERDGIIAFRFRNGQTLESRVLERRPPYRLVLTYFGGSRVEIDLAADGRGGTDLSLCESEVPASELMQNLPGWVSLLLSLKAAVDFGVDLRNADPERQWEQGYVDV
jgi:uncharacterized protein YndB with AHSA1/START domain